MITIETYTLSQLESYCLSDEYRALKTKPISLFRMRSYCNNPRANADDVVMYLAKNENNIVGFRTILSDKDALGKTFGWLSGNWVHKKERRKGVSTLLLQEVLKDWDNRLMHVNVSPASKAVYDTSGAFKQYASIQGKRLYFRFSLHQLLPSKNRRYIAIKPALWLLDVIGNVLLAPISQVGSKQNLSDVSFVETIDDECLSFIQQNIKPSLQLRNSSDFTWISQYPWLYKTMKNDADTKQYPFSSGFDDYKRFILKITDSNGKMQAFVMMHCKKACATVPFYITNSTDEKRAAAIIMNICKIQKLNYLTTFNSDLLQHLQSIHIPSLFQKPLKRNYYATSPLFESLPYAQTIHFQDGDGDCAFV